MVLRFSLFFSISIILFSCSENQSSVNNKENTDKNATPNPQALYAIHCDACHGMDGKKGISGAADLSVSKLTDKEIESTIKNGNDKGMMPFKDIITNPNDIKSLVEYVKKLKK